jgi:hypothetical protein
MTLGAAEGWVGSAAVASGSVSGTATAAIINIK